MDLINSFNPFAKVTEFANLIFAITFIQWMSTLSGYLDDIEYIGWILTFIFALIYIKVLVLLYDMDSISDIYRSGHFKTQLEYNILWLFGVFILLLFIPISFLSNNISNSFTYNVIVTIILWTFFLLLVIPNLMWKSETLRVKLEGII